MKKNGFKFPILPISVIIVLSGGIIPVFLNRGENVMMQISISNEILGAVIAGVVAIVLAIIGGIFKFFRDSKDIDQISTQTGKIKDKATTIESEMNVVRKDTEETNREMFNTVIPNVKKIENIHDFVTESRALQKASNQSGFNGERMLGDITAMLGSITKLQSKLDALEKNSQQREKELLKKISQLEEKNAELKKSNQKLTQASYPNAPE